MKQHQPEAETLSSLSAVISTASYRYTIRHVGIQCLNTFLALPCTEHGQHGAAGAEGIAGSSVSFSKPDRLEKE